MASKLNRFINTPDWSMLFEPSATHNDPSLSGYWHLGNATGATKGVNVLDVWDEFRGAGIIVGMIDDGVEYTHPELISNYNTALDFDARDNDFDAYSSDAADRHGTTTAGVVGAALDNGIGGAGVAPAVTLVGYRMGFGANGSEAQIDALFARLAVLDVANNSWGYDGFLGDDFVSPDFAPIAAHLVGALDTGRGGLGTIVVFSAANARAEGQDVNYHNFQNHRGIITVAATDSAGNIASFSTPGDAILVAAPGVGIQTTDRVGAAGFAVGDFVSVNGTSFSAPIVSGVAALMLDANPDLGWRDVQEIFASTAIQTGNPASSSFNHAGNWNGGAMRVSRDFGFGLVDAMAAVRVAESWHQISNSANEVFVGNSVLLNAPIPDLGNVQSVLNLTAGVRIDHVEVDLNLLHSFIGDLRVTLTSPTGTQSVLFNNPPTSQDNIFFTFSTTHDWGELSGGAWTLNVSDPFAQDTGTLLSWAIRAYGDPVGNDTYLYTDEFGTLAAGDFTRRTLSDASGIDGINTAAIASATTLDLRPGQTSVIDGLNVAISGGTVIENADTGDGNDTVIGNDAANWLRGWRGNDTLDGGFAADTLEGGPGNDIYFVDQIGDVVVENAGAGTDTVQSTITYSIAGAANLENVTLIGSGATNATGNNGNNVLNGNSASNVLDGGGGIDTLVGGPGDDTYMLDSTTDTIIETAGQGKDTVQSSVTYSIATAPNVENVRLTGAGAINATGNALNNMLTGNDSGNTLEGGAGDDLIYGFDPNGPQANVSSIAATRVAAGLSEPLYAVSPRGDLDRLFIVEKSGRIKILELATQQVLATPFLNLAGQIATSGEQGLLGLAFDPDYAQNGFFYVNLINPSGDTQIRRYQVSSADPNLANAASATPVITIDQPAGLTNHKAGWLDFGPDGYLYAALGDGGGSGDPNNNAQNLNSLLGKMLRLDVRSDGFPGDSTRNYSIPADNPFAAAPGADEIWALGLRNPWRPGFDRGLGDLYIADVGQNVWEEIDLGQAGVNYGWDLREGPDPFAGGSVPAPIPFTDPIYTYQQAGSQSITGGYVYRGPGEGLHGQYFFADFISAKIFTLRFNGSSWVATERTAQITADAGTIDSPASFGQDGSGNLYIVDIGGEVFRLTPNVNSADQGDVLLGMAGNDMLFGGSGADTLNGGADNDELQGGAGNDLLDGAEGDDTLIGGQGDDTYIVDSLGDAVSESPGASTDTVQSTVTYVLDANVENLTLTGSAPINASGNALANVLRGNSASNTLNGGVGNDVYLFNTGFGVDVVVDTDATVGNVDIVRFGAGITPVSVVASRSAANLVLTRGAESVTVQNWFASAADKIERVEFADGTFWDVATLQAMTGGNHPPVGVNDAVAVNENAITANLVAALLANDTDPDAADTKRISAVNTAGTLGTVAFDAALQTLTYSANAAAHNALAQGATAIDSFTYTVADGQNATASVTVTVTITGVNDAPTLANPLADQSATEGAAFGYTFPANSFADLDVGDALTYSATLAGGGALPGWLSFNALTRTFVGTPPGGSAGTLNVRVTATDSQGAFALDVFDISVSAGGGSVINGTAGADTLNGTAGNDTINGLGGSDTLNGLDGNDTLTGGAGVDTLNGGNGDDTLVIVGSDGANWDIVNGGNGFDLIQGGAGNDTFRLWSYSGANTVEKIDGGAGVNVIAAVAGFNTVLDLSGTQLVNIAQINGDTGGDTITGSAANDVIAGGAGVDTLNGGNGDDTFVILGTDGVNWDIVNGGAGFDVIQGGAGDDTFRLWSYSGANTVEKIDGGAGINVIAAVAGFNTVLDLSGTQLVNIAQINGDTGGDTITGSTGNDYIAGGAGSDILKGNAGNDLINGGSAGDTLNGDADNDVLEGMDGDDIISDSSGNNLFNGGTGNDTLTGNSGNELFIGGAGNDTINTNTGADIIAFNRGDGQDTLNASTVADNTLSLGGGIRYADMSFTKSGSHLELNLGGAAEKVTLANWYLSAPANKSVINLQVIAEAMVDFNAGSADPLLNKKVQNFDFRDLVSAFDAAGAPNNWALMNALLSEHLTGSDTEALGGDLAYRYGLGGSLAGIGFDPALVLLSNASFGTAPQTLQPLQNLQQGLKRLS